MIEQVPLIPLIPPNINFNQLKKEAASQIFKIEEFRQHAFQVLAEVQLISSQIGKMIESYNQGNTALKKALIENIDRVLKNTIHKSHFPFTFDKGEIMTLKGFFSPIKKECICLKNQLNQDETEAEERKRAFENEKNWRLSSLLRNEQESLFLHPEIMVSFLEKLQIEISKKNAIPTVYFAYAWPTEGRKKGESWVQGFLKNLHDQLRLAGIQTARLDIVTNRYGKNIYKFMKKAKTDDYILLFGTESLKDKHDQGFSAVCTELNVIFHKRQIDVKKGMARVFPILISGTLETALPDAYERYTTVRDWRKGSYLTHLQTLYLELFDLAPVKYLKAVESFWTEALQAAQDEQQMITIKTAINWYKQQRQIVENATTSEELTQVALQIPSLAQGISQAPLPWKEQFILRLKDHYRTCNTISILTVKTTGEWERELPIESLYTHLAMIDEEERKEKQTSSNVVEDGRQTTYETILQAKKEIRPEDLFSQKKMEESHQKRAVIYGSAGIGKSTFISYATHTWAQGKLWPEFEVVLCVRLRNLTKSFYPKGRDYTPYAILQREHVALQMDFEELLKDKALLNKTLLILDGYDELPNEANTITGHLYNAFKELKELFPHILITSRPGSIGIDYKCEFEILGFNNEQIANYISKFFNNKELEPSRRLLNYLNKTSLARSLSHIPINLTILCSLAEENENLFNAEIPLTMTQLYDQIVKQFYKVFLVKNGESIHEVLEISNPKKHPSLSPLVAILEEMAFSAVSQRTLYLDHDKIEDIVFEKKFKINQIKQVGLYRIDPERGCFIHLTFQEYFAASYVARLYTEDKRSDAQKILKENKFKPHFSLVWRMTAGILSLQRTDKERLQEFFDDLFAPPNDLAVRAELQLIAVCFEECQQREWIRQYGNFIDACQDYTEKIITTFPVTDAVFNLFQGNSTLLNHDKMVAVIKKMLKTSRSSEMLKCLDEVASLKQQIPNEIAKFVISFKYENEITIFSILRSIAERERNLPKKAISRLIDSFNEDFISYHSLNENLIFCHWLYSEIWKNAILALGSVKINKFDLIKKVLDKLTNLLAGFKISNGVKEIIVEMLLEIIEERHGISKKVQDELINLRKRFDRRWNLRKDPKFDLNSCIINGFLKIAENGYILPQEILDASIDLCNAPEITLSIKIPIFIALDNLKKNGCNLPRKIPKSLINLLKNSYVDLDTKRNVISVFKELVYKGYAFPKEMIDVLINFLKNPQQFPLRLYLLDVLWVVKTRFVKFSRDFY